MYPQFIVADDLQVKCYALLSKAVKQQKVAAEAKQLLTSPRDYGEACNSLISYLYEHGQFSEADLWNQMRYAAEQAALPMVKRLAKTLSIPEASMLQAIDKPAVVLKKAPPAGRAGHELYLIALGRMAKTDLDAAVDAMEKHQSKFTEKETAQGWANIALQAALKLKPQANEYWQKAHSANFSQEAYQWRVRSALRETDWHAVKQAIAALPKIYVLIRHGFTGRDAPCKMKVKRRGGKIIFQYRWANEFLWSVSAGRKRA